MANLGSFIRSAARATFSAYRRLPIRWRIAGGSAALTLVILCGFAAVVGVLTTERINSDFQHQVRNAANVLEQKIHLVEEMRNGKVQPKFRGEPIDFEDFAASPRAAIRVISSDNQRVDGTKGSPNFGVPTAATSEINGWRVESRPLRVGGVQPARYYVQYARRVSDVEATERRVRLFLALGVLGGAALSLLAGLATARRAMAPIARLSETARKIERTRDPTIRIPHPQSEDEVAELARTLEGMLQALNDARAETEAALARQREFVADASHELRTPLTAALPNLELLEETLKGDQRAAASAALRSTRRMRRLVADLLLLARADVAHSATGVPVDLSDVVVEACAELDSLAGDHQLDVKTEPGAIILGRRDEVHRLVLNLLENALRHTPAGTTVQMIVHRSNGEILLTVEDNGPGIPPELRERVFERFFRGRSDRGGSTGLGLAIVRAVAISHAADVVLSEPTDGKGTRFVIRFPAAPLVDPLRAEQAKSPSYDSA